MTTPNIPEAVKAIPGDNGIQLGAFDTPDKIVVVGVPVKQGLLFDPNKLESEATNEES